MKKTIIMMACAGAAMLVNTACSSDNDVYDPATYKAEQLAQNFENKYGEIAADQDWNTVVNLTGSVKVNYDGNFTIRIYNSDPTVDNSEARVLASYTLKGGETGTYTFNAPDLSTVFVQAITETNKALTEAVAVKDKKFSAVIGSTSASARGMRKAAAVGDFEQTTDYKLFSSETMTALGKALPDKEPAYDLMNDYEMMSKGEVTIWPVYGEAWESDEVGYYYYNPADSAGTYREVKIIDDTHNFGEDMQWVKSDGTVINYNFGSDPKLGGSAYREDNNTPVQSKGYKINIPKGWYMGFYIHNRSREDNSFMKRQGWADHTRYYSDRSRNYDGWFHSATVEVDGVRYVGLEDAFGESAYVYGMKTPSTWDMDCNDIVFCVDGAEPIVPGEDPEYYTYTIAYEDLGTTDDFDFNDIVLYVTYNNLDDSVTVDLMAAGGTLPVDIYFGEEKLFSKEGGISNTSTFNGKINSKTIKVENFDLTKAETYSKFILYVTNTDNDNTSTFKVSANDQKGKAPQAIIIADKWAWPTERTDIGDAYPNFKNWVRDTSASDWYLTPVEGKVVKP